MGIAGSIVTIVLFWWIAFFCMMSVGIKTQFEVGEIVPGTSPSAPAVHHLLRKALASLAIALVCWGIVFAIVHYKVITYDELMGNV